MREADAERRRSAVRSRPTAALWVLWGAYSLALGFLYKDRPPCPDLATFDYVGWLVGAGATPYVDVIEQNWPGPIWLHTVSTALFGNHLWSFRVFDYGLLLAASLTLRALLRRAGRPIAGWIVMPLHQTMYVVANLWFIGQRDVVGAHLLLIAGWAYLVRIEGGRRAWVVPLGLGTTLVTLIRPTFLLFPVLLLAIDLVLARRNGRSKSTVLGDMAIAGAASLGSLALLALWFAQAGALSGFWSAAVLFNTQLYSQTASFADVTATILSLREGWHWYLALSGVGIVTWARQGERNVFALLLSFFVLGTVSIYVQRKAFGYHIGPWIIGLSAFTAEALDWSVRTARRARRPLPALVSLLLCLLVVLGAAKKIDGALGPQLRHLTGRINREQMNGQLRVGVAGVSAQDLLDAAAFAGAHAGPDDTVLVWSRAIAINFLAKRRLPTPLATVGALRVARAPFVDAEVWLSQFEDALERPPAVIFAPGASSPAYGRLWDDPEPPRATLAVRRVLRERFRKVASFGALDAYLPGAGLPRSGQ